MVRGSWLILALAAALVALAPTSRAGDVDAGARRSRVAARVGPRAITVGEIEDRLAALAPVQRASFGATRDAVRRSFLEEVLVRDALLSLGAEASGLASKPPASTRIERAVSAATVRAIRARIGPASAIPMEDVTAYYERNRARYEAPERYQIWRILCKTEDEAQTVLDAARRDPTPATFGALAREHSLDKATNLRAGNLGFVDADGASKEPGLRVDPAVVRAAQSVRDTEIVPAPVAEGEYFSVVWRRATLAPAHRSVSEAAPQIRDVLWKTRVKEETDKLLASLRAARLRDFRPELLDAVDIPADDEAGGLSGPTPRDAAGGPSIRAGR